MNPKLSGLRQARHVMGHMVQLLPARHSAQAAQNSCSPAHNIAPTKAVAGARLRRENTCSTKVATKGCYRRGRKTGTPLFRPK